MVMGQQPNQALGNWQLTIEQNNLTVSQNGGISSCYGIRSYYTVEAPSGLNQLPANSTQQHSNLVIQQPNLAVTDFNQSYSRQSSAALSVVASEYHHRNRSNIPSACPSHRSLVPSACPSHRSVAFSENRETHPIASGNLTINNVTLTPHPSPLPSIGQPLISGEHTPSSRQERPEPSRVHAHREPNTATRHNYLSTAPENRNFVNSTNIMNKRVKKRKTQSLPELNQSGYLVNASGQFTQTNGPIVSDLRIPHIRRPSQSYSQMQTFPSLTSSLPALPVSIRKSPQPNSIFLVQQQSNPKPIDQHHFYDEHGNEIMPHVSNADFQQSSYHVGSQRFPYSLPPIGIQSIERSDSPKPRRQFRLHVHLEYGCIQDQSKAQQLPDCVLKELEREYGHLEIAEVIIIKRDGDYSILTRPQRRSTSDGHLLKHYKPVIKEQENYEYNYDNDKFEQE